MRRAGMPRRWETRIADAYAGSTLADLVGRLPSLLRRFVLRFVSNTQKNSSTYLDSHFLSFSPTWAASSSHLSPTFLGQPLPRTTFCGPLLVAITLKENSPPLLPCLVPHAYPIGSAPCNFDSESSV
eukprot:357296-Chlamydomonas_euryale.AAC.4